MNDVSALRIFTEFAQSFQKRGRIRGASSNERTHTLEIERWPSREKQSSEHCLPRWDSERHRLVHPFRPRSSAQAILSLSSRHKDSAANDSFQRGQFYDLSRERVSSRCVLNLPNSGRIFSTYQTCQPLPQPNADAKWQVPSSIVALVSVVVGNGL